MSDTSVAPNRTHGKILIIADESASWEVGGLKQLDRMLLNVNEAFQEEAALTLNVFVFWKRGEKKLWGFSHPLLNSCKPQMSDDPDSLAKWLNADQQDTFVVKTNLLLGRGCLNSKSLPYSLIFKANEHLELAGKIADVLLWEHFSSLLEKNKTPELSEEQGFCEWLGSQRDVEAGERRLFETLGKPTDGLVSTLLNRPLSTRLSRHLASTPITPTIWTAILFLVTLSGIWALALGSGAGFIWGTFLFQIVSALDGCDGELARVRFQESKQGEWIDTISDLSGNVMFLFALGVGLSRQEGIDTLSSHLYFIEGAVTSLALLGTLWAVHGYTKKRESSGHFNNFGNSIISEMELPDWLQRLSHFVAKILKRDTYTLIFFFMAVFGQSSWILHLMGAGIIFHLAVLVRPIVFPTR